MPSRCGVIFDFNGVIVDDEELHYQAAVRVCQGVGVQLDREEYFKLYPGRLPSEMFRSILERSGSTASVGNCVKMKVRYYEEEFWKGVRTFPGVTDVIRALRNAAFRLAIGSTSERRFITAVLQQLRIIDSFSVIVSGEDVRIGKPAPEVYLLAAQRLNLPPHRCLAVEDSLNGIAAARAAGMKCVAVTTTFSAVRLDRADLVLDTLADLRPETVLELLR